MAKIKNDKYYTPSDLAEYCVNKTKEIIGESNISEYLEPSAGGGIFLNYLPINTYACDIEPEDNRIEKKDYLSLDLEYKKGRCVIGNPPFGTKLNLFVQFFNKSIEIADYIAFICPISQLNNTIKTYKFDLIYSENLGNVMYSDREVPTCFNIYKRPLNGELNTKDNGKLKDVTIRECRQNSNPKRAKPYTNFEYDYAICAWGQNIGKELKYPTEYTKEFYFIIKNKELKNEIINCIQNTNWVKEFPMTATPNLLHWQVYKILKRDVKGIK